MWRPRSRTLIRSLRSAYFRTNWSTRPWQQATPRAIPGGGENRSRMLGFYANANYIFGNRYFADFSIRYEGSSKFGTDNRFAPFGSLGFGWNIHKEKFIQTTKISLLKLRASIGFVGNANFNPYQAQLSYRYSSDLYYNGNIGAVPGLNGKSKPQMGAKSEKKHRLGLRSVC